MNRYSTFALAVMAVIGVAPADAQPAPNSIDAHLAAAKKAGGFEFRGLLGALCVAPRNTATRDATPAPPPPDRARWYTEPAKVFDDVYFVGTKDRSSWALTTSEGIILIDTTCEYETEPVIVGGLVARMKLLRPDARRRKRWWSHSTGDCRQLADHADAINLSE